MMMPSSNNKAHRIKAYAPTLIHLGQITSECSNSPQHGSGRSQDHYTVNKGKNLKYLRAKTYDHRMINTHVEKMVDISKLLGKTITNCY